MVAAELFDYVTLEWSFVREELWDFISRSLNRELR